MIAKKFLHSLSDAANQDNMKSLFIKAQSELARASGKGVIKARRASRLTSRLNSKLKEAASKSAVSKQDNA